MNFESPAGPRRRGIFILGLASASVLALVILLAIYRRADSAPPPPPRATTGDDAWETTSEGEFEERSAHFTGSRLKLRASTRHKPGDSVKFPRADPSRFVGVRRREEVRLTPGTRISVDLDWNNQGNGSGLSAGIVLSPLVTKGNPYIQPACLWVEYIGVPPGKNARRVIGVREASNHRHLDSEGWPDQNREGRPIGLQKLEIRIGEGGSFRIFENGVEAYASGPKALAFDRAYVYLQMSSRSNYPPREVFFDNLVVDAGR
jgi:hypothetical protein